MDIKLISIVLDSKKLDWALDFKVLIDGIELTGKAFNYNINSDHRDYTKNKFYGIRLKFNQPNIKKHPKYSEIRGKIVTAIFEHQLAEDFKWGAAL